MKELIEAYDEYIELLGRGESSMIGLAIAHGYRCPREMVDRGIELRTKIAELKKSLLAACN